MSTGWKTWHRPLAPHSPPPARSDQQLKRDRRTAMVVLAIMLALMALVIWLASLGEGVPVDTDYWPMMP